MCRATPTKITVIKSPTFRKRRRVRFSADAASTLTSEPTTHKALNNSCDPSTKYSGSFLSQEEIDNRWYNRFDEKCFRYEAVRDLAEYKRRGQKEMVPRGLEKHCPERRMHKKEAVRLVLLAQRMGYHPDEIAMVSQTKSSWNAEIAATQATLDRVDVLIEENNLIISMQQMQELHTSIKPSIEPAIEPAIESAIKPAQQLLTA